MRLSEPMCDAVVLCSVVGVNLFVGAWFGVWWLLLSVPISAVAGLIAWLLLLFT
jgi:hypothetical protein